MGRVRLVEVPNEIDIENDGSDLVVTSNGNTIFKAKSDGRITIKRIDVGDYGGGFANYTPPTGEDGDILIAVDTNANNPGTRLYIYANGSWHYVELSG